MNSSSRQKAATRFGSMAYWIATILSALAFAVPGIALLIRVPHFVDEMAHLGYPSYFLPFLGTWKVLGAATIVAPRLPRVKEWAYAGMMFDIAGAIVSRSASGDGLSMIIGPVAIGGIVIASWALRPSRRSLQASSLTNFSAESAARSES